MHSLMRITDEQADSQAHPYTGCDCAFPQLSLQINTLAIGGMHYTLNLGRYATTG